MISLPTLLAEGDRTPFSFFFSYETMMRIMEEPKHARVAKSFVNEDHDRGGLPPSDDRIASATNTASMSVNDLRAIVRKHGFKPVLVGGIYYLQGRLAQLVASSLVTGSSG